MAAAGLDIVAEHAIDATLDTFEDLYRGLAARNRVHIGRAA
jgi:hypothetical protein